MERVNIAVTPTIQKIFHPQDIQSSSQTEAKPKFTTFDGAKKGIAYGQYLHTLLTE